MAKRFDIALVIDVEATCWEGKPPGTQVSEIIEIGLCPVRLDTGKRVEKRSILIKPQMSEVSPFCTELTTITQELLEREGIGFKDACRILEKEYTSQQRIWVSWGNYDRDQFMRDCTRKKIRSPFGPSHINIKELFAVLKGEAHTLGARGAVERLGFEFEGTHHRGHDDAWNIARVFSHVMMASRSVLT